MMKKFNTLLILFIFLFTSCQSIKDGLSGRKNENSDEFLVKKKNPLVTPPKFMELPKPSSKKENTETKQAESDFDIKDILEIEKSSEVSSKSGSAEDFVLKQIQDK